MGRLLRNLLVGLSLVAAPAQAATYYVATTGAGSTCSFAAPCGTLDAGLSKLAAGDTLYLRGGTYNASFFIQAGNYASGTSYANAVTIAGYPGETAIIISAAFKDASTHHIIVQDLVMDGINIGGTSEGVFQGVDVHHIIIQRCEIKNAGGQGVHSDDSGIDLQYLNNNIHGNGRNVAFDGSQSHGMYLNSPAAIIDGNDIWNNASYGLQIYHSGGSSRCDGCIVRNNRIHDNHGVDGAVNINMASNVLFYNNLIYNNDGGGVNSIHFGSPSNIAVYNNTITGNHGPCVEVDAGTNALVKNNLCWNNGGSAAFVDTGSGTTFAGNLCNSGGVGCSIIGNPQFTNAGALDFTLQAGSAAIDAGVTLAAVPVDLQGTPRPQGSAYDIGAYEFMTGTPPAPQAFRVNSMN